MNIEDIRPNLYLENLSPGEVAKVLYVAPAGTDAVRVVYETPSLGVRDRQVFRSDAAGMRIADTLVPWSFSSPGKEFALALEAFRIKLADCFDPMMAVHASTIEPLPHQISAVYDVMLKKQPLRFVLADDPGAGKTIMAGLLIKELVARASARRVLIVSPGSLTEQWQDELRDKFSLDFRLLSREAMELSASGNFFTDEDFVIARLDMLSRSDELRDRLAASPQWDLVIVDEAHKLSAHLVGREVKSSLRYRLGELLASRTRHFLLMTATPHNGHEDDFRLWMSLIDHDRFFGRVSSDEPIDVSDVMRRLIKEELRRFDGTHLFPQRKATTVDYDLSPEEKALYDDVTAYVRDEMGRAEALESGRAGSCVGFALTMLQRRLASSPQAIHLSLCRRLERLEALLESGAPIRGRDLPDDFDEDDFSGEEADGQEINGIVSSSTASRNRLELEAEIATLRRLAASAKALRASGTDRKWTELRTLFDNEALLRREDGSLRKIIVFTEHRDTLDYLADRIRDYYGRSDAVVTISGATSREDRREAQNLFRNDKDVVCLVATDAAGEGVNLQNTNVMINYDLPWNPNRLEQRFGRIHRIGQREFCYLWNLVARETREGDVFRRLFDKLERESQTLGGRVFDILGEAFRGVSLKDIIVEAIRAGESPEARRYMEEVDSALDTERLRAIIRANALTNEVLSPEQVATVRAEMEKAEARRLQPCYIRDFVRASLRAAGGETRPRDGSRRFEVPHVPAEVRASAALARASRDKVLGRYERICFRKEDVHVRDGDREAELISCGHPLLTALVEWTERNCGKYLKAGAAMIDPVDEGREPSLLFLVDHSVVESTPRQDGADEVASRRLQFVRLRSDGTLHRAGWAPHLDLEPLPDRDEAITALIARTKSAAWLAGDLEARAADFATSTIAREHYEEVAKRRTAQTDKELHAVQAHLMREIDWYETEAIKMDRLVAEGRQPPVQSANLRATEADLASRLAARKEEIDRRRKLVSKQPRVIGGILVLPKGLVAEANGTATFSTDAEARRRVERFAMEAVMNAEREGGWTPTDVSSENCGWDITSVKGDQVRHIEVKGRRPDATTITVTRNEVYTAVNQADKFILAVVKVDEEGSYGMWYISNPFRHEMDDNVVSQNYDLSALIVRGLRMRGDA